MRANLSTFEFGTVLGNWTTNGRSSNTCCNWRMISCTTLSKPHSLRRAHSH
ncbi:hypothetical protein ACFCXQ_04495 [Qipengyuania sp. DGS5-3]